MTPWRKSSYSHGGCCIEVAWRKSSHSRDDACVEVNAPFRTSSHSGGSGCVEVARMRKSSYSNPDGNCLEVAHGTTTAVIRDSKNPTAAHLTVPGPSWAAFLDGIHAGHFRA